MITETELSQMEANLNHEDIPRLISEIKRLKQYVHDYSNSVSHKIDAIEQNMILLENENSRLLSVKDVGYIERDVCIGLLASLAQAKGFRAGTVSDKFVVIDLPAGQVSWEYQSTEAHLFSGLPSYPDPIDEISIEEKYRRVMNPGIQSQ
jgi:hypothetical protein